ncbi:unnamed protein product, partial [Thlaspi arvense]
MDRINELSDHLLVKILSFVPTKVSVSTSILSKRWEFLWMWVPKLEYIDYEDVTDFSQSHYEDPHYEDVIDFSQSHYEDVTGSSQPSILRYRDFINQNLPLHKAPIIESLRLRFLSALFRHADLNLWVEIAVSRCVRELELCIDHDSVLPNSLYTCKSLVTLKLQGKNVLVDVPGTVCLPSLKTLELKRVAYFNEDSLRLLLSCCPVLEDLVIFRDDEPDNLKVLVVTVPSLQRLWIINSCSSGDCVIDTPSLKYFEVEDHRDSFSYSIKHMTKLEEAYISVKKAMYHAGIVFDQLEHLKLSVMKNDWSKLLFRLLNDSPKLQVLSLSVFGFFVDQEQISWSIEQSSIPKCLLKSFETFEFRGYYKGGLEERDILSFLFKHDVMFRSLETLCNHYFSGCLKL